jgi:hypothetical protein
VNACAGWYYFPKDADLHEIEQPVEGGHPLREGRSTTRHSINLGKGDPSEALPIKRQIERLHRRCDIWDDEGGR